MSVTTKRMRQIADASADHTAECAYGAWEDRCTCHVINDHPESIDQSRLYGYGGVRLDKVPRLLWWLADLFE